MGNGKGRDGTKEGAMGPLAKGLSLDLLRVGLIFAGRPEA